MWEARKTPQNLESRKYYGTPKTTAKYWTVKEHRNSAEQYKQHKHCKARPISNFPEAISLNKALILTAQYLWTNKGVREQREKILLQAETQMGCSVPALKPSRWPHVPRVPKLWLGYRIEALAKVRGPSFPGTSGISFPLRLPQINPGRSTYQLLGFSPALYLARIPRNDRSRFPAEQRRSAPVGAGARAGDAAGRRRYLYALYLWMARFTLRS